MVVALRGFMVQRRIPLTVYQPSRPGVHSFAILASFEAAARSILISVFPVLLLRGLGNAEGVSEIYLLAGLVSLVVALVTPFIAQYVARRWLYTAGCLGMINGNILALAAGPQWMGTVLIANAASLVIMTICFNAYVMDFIERTSLGKNESTRLLYSGAAWAIGPALGVWLMDISPDIPFLVSIIACLCLLGFFWYLRMGDGKVIVKAQRPARNPLSYIARFLKQKPLVAGWLFASVRSVGWWVYIVYLPVFAINNGLGDKLGGTALSVSNAFLFAAPLMLRFIVSKNVRMSIVLGFGASGILFLVAALSSFMPLVTIVALVAATVFLVLLDVCAGLPFLMLVKPSERTEMATVYSTYRDVSSVATPGIARLILIFSPVTGIFLVCGLGLLACAAVALRLPKRLGEKRGR